MAELLNSIVPPIVIFVELIGVVIILFGILKAIYYLILSKFDLRNESLIVEIASSLSLALEFFLAAEILMTLVINDMQQLILLGVILVLRIIITFVLHWELKSIEESQNKLKNTDA